MRPDLDRALVSPAAVFASPHEAVRHPLLTSDTKRVILWRWASDEYLLDLALADGMPEGEPSRLPEVKSALRLVNMHWNLDPAAPAMRVPRIEHDEVLLAARALRRARLAEHPTRRLVFLGGTRQAGRAPATFGYLYAT